MVTYIALVNWTDQGIKNVKQSPQRLDAARALATKLKCKLRDFYLTVGSYDMVCVLEAPDDEAAASFLLALGAGGNTRTTTLKAFAEDSYRKIIAGLA
jgi:uncharacterized protein with GYD domain